MKQLAANSFRDGLKLAGKELGASHPITQQLAQASGMTKVCDSESSSFRIRRVRGTNRSATPVTKTPSPTRSIGSPF
jgi:hypothetical protein